MVRVGKAEGIDVLYDGLVAAGYNVTLVAPKEQQSGQGTLINVDSLFQPTEVVEFEENKWFFITSGDNSNGTWHMAHGAHDT